MANTQPTELDLLKSVTASGTSGDSLVVSGTVTTTSSLPAGAATSAKQDTGNTSLASIDGKITAVNTGAVVVASSALPSGASTSANQTTGNASLSSIDSKSSTVISNLQALNSLVPTTYDYISLGYTGADLTTVVYKLGGSGGTTVSTLTLAYSSSILQSVTKT